MSGRTLTDLVHSDGYVIVFAVVALQALGAPLPGTTALIAAALYAAATHRLSIVWIIAVGTLGALIGTSLGYLVGRRGGERLLTGLARRLRQPPERIARVQTGLARHGGPWLVIARHVTGLRNLAGIVAGASGMPARRFLVWSALAAVIWATVAGLEYYLFGSAIVNAPTWLQILLVVVGLAVTGLVLRAAGSRSRSRSRARRAPSPP
jgi:membrane protein DedA with SNARE-associated domain